MLTLSSVTKHFGGLQVLEDFTLTVSEPGVFGLIGPNGAGKTTVFNLITGLISPSGGTIDFMGQRLDGKAPYEITRLGVARTFQNIRVFKEMTVLENVLVALGDHPRYGAFRSLWPGRGFRRALAEEQDTCRHLLARVGLEDKSDQAAGTLAYGEQRRVELARALATQPKLLLLDEPAAGMNNAEKQELMDEIVKLGNEGLGILIIEHDMRFVMELCREIAVLNFGRLIARGSPEEIRANPLVIEAYLGREQEGASSAQS